MLLSNIFVNLECGGEYDMEQLSMWSPTQYPEFPQGGLQHQREQLSGERLHKIKYNIRWGLVH